MQEHDPASGRRSTSGAPEGQHTCGKGLAERSVLPASAARLMSSLADVLAIHMRALDLADEDARKEHAAYARLEAAYRDAASLVRAIASDMAGCADLPMGRHDLRAMTGATARDAFAAFLKVEEEVLVRLRAVLERDRAMLELMQQTLPEQR